MVVASTSRKDSPRAVLAEFYSSAMDVFATHQTRHYDTLNQAVVDNMETLSHSTRNKINKLNNAYKCLRHLTAMYTDDVLNSIRSELGCHLRASELPGRAQLPDGYDALQEQLRALEAQIAELRDAQRAAAADSRPPPAPALASATRTSKREER